MGNVCSSDDAAAVKQSAKASSADKPQAPSKKNDGKTNGTAAATASSSDVKTSAASSTSGNTNGASSPSRVPNLAVTPPSPQIDPLEPPPTPKLSAMASSSATGVIGHPVATGNGSDVYNDAQRKEEAGDLSGAFEGYTIAARTGLPLAKLKLAFFYLFGCRTIMIDTRVALHHLRVALQARVPTASSLLAWCYAEGHGVTKDRKRASQLYATMSEDDPYAQVYLAAMLADQGGRGGKQRRARAHELLSHGLPVLRRYQELGDIRAAAAIGECYRPRLETNDTSIIHVSRSEAHSALTQAAMAGHVEAAVWLAKFSQWKEDDDGDLTENRDNDHVYSYLYRQAAAVGYPRAQRRVALLLHHGHKLGFTDGRAAIRMLRRAVAAGNAYAKMDLADALINGRLPSINGKATAVTSPSSPPRLLSPKTLMVDPSSPSIAQPQSQQVITGDTIIREGVALLEAAAEAGVPKAQFVWAQRLLDTQQTAEAYSWLARSSGAGYRAATRLLSSFGDEAKEHLTEAKRIRAANAVNDEPAGLAASIGVLDAWLKAHPLEPIAHADRPGQPAYHEGLIRERAGNTRGALTYFHTAHAAGHWGAAYKLAQYALFGMGCERADPTRGLALAEEAAAHGINDSRSLVAFCHQLGLGVAADAEHARRLWLALPPGHVYGDLHLSLLPPPGDTGDTHAITNTFVEAYRRGLPESLHIAMEHGEMRVAVIWGTVLAGAAAAGHAIDPWALHHLRVAADMGHGQAQITYAAVRQYLPRALVLPWEPPATHYLYRAARQGIAVAWQRLSHELASLPFGEQRTLQCLKQAIKLGDVDAGLRLAYWYRSGSTAVSRDLVEAAAVAVEPIAHDGVNTPPLSSLEIAKWMALLQSDTTPTYEFRTGLLTQLQRLADDPIKSWRAQQLLSYWYGLHASPCDVERASQYLSAAGARLTQLRAEDPTREGMERICDTILESAEFKSLVEQARGIPILQSLCLAGYVEPNFQLGTALTYDPEGRNYTRGIRLLLQALGATGFVGRNRSRDDALKTRRDHWTKILDIVLTGGQVWDEAEQKVVGEIHKMVISAEPGAILVVAHAVSQLDIVVKFMTESKQQTDAQAVTAAASSNGDNSDVITAPLSPTDTAAVPSMDDDAGRTKALAAARIAVEALQRWFVNDVVPPRVMRTIIARAFPNLPAALILNELRIGSVNGTSGAAGSPSSPLFASISPQALPRVESKHVASKIPLLDLLADLDELESKEAKVDKEALSLMADGALREDVGNHADALPYYIRAAERKHAPAIMKVSCYYLFGLRSVPTDLPRGIGLLKKAAKMGAPESRALLALCFLRGYATPANRDHAGSALAKADKHDPLATFVAIAVAGETAVGTPLGSVDVLEAARAGVAIAAGQGSLAAHLLWTDNPKSLRDAPSVVDVILNGNDYAPNFFAAALAAQQAAAAADEKMNPQPTPTAPIHHSHSGHGAVLPAHGDSPSRGGSSGNGSNPSSPEPTTPRGGKRLGRSSSFTRSPVGLGGGPISSTTTSHGGHGHGHVRTPSGSFTPSPLITPSPAAGGAPSSSSMSHGRSHSAAPSVAVLGRAQSSIAIGSHSSGGHNGHQASPADVKLNWD